MQKIFDRKVIQNAIERNSTNDSRAHGERAKYEAFCRGGPLTIIRSF